MLNGAAEHKVWELRMWTAPIQGPQTAGSIHQSDKVLRQPKTRFENIHEAFVKKASSIDDDW